MSDVTRILSQINDGDPKAAAQLFPLVYDELRRLAAAKTTHETPAQTLQATALVYEVYLKLMGGAGQRAFAIQRHLFAAAAEAMRQILEDRARRKLTMLHGGPWRKQETPQAVTGAQQGFWRDHRCRQMTGPVGQGAHATNPSRQDAALSGNDVWRDRENLGAISEYSRVRLGLRACLDEASLAAEMPDHCLEADCCRILPGFNPEFSPCKYGMSDVRPEFSVWGRIHD